MSCAALSCVPLLGLETVAAALLFFGLCGALGGCCGGLQAGLYVGFVLGEALLGVAVSGGLVFAASTLLADERGRIDARKQKGRDERPGSDSIRVDFPRFSSLFSWFLMVFHRFSRRFRSG